MRAMPVNKAEGASGLRENPRHFLDIDQFNQADLRAILQAADQLKSNRGIGVAQGGMQGKTLAMIFERPSTRTRVSFEVGMKQLGGEVVMLTAAEMQLGRGEAIQDTARVLSRYVDAIMIRAANEKTLEEMASAATVPVINGLTNRSHPCQIMADIMTFEEKRGSIAGRKVAWSGDGNNVCVSWIHAAVRFGFELHIATPAELAPEEALVDWARREGAKVVVCDDPKIAAKDAHVVVTDAWVSMHHTDGVSRHNRLKAFQVNDDVMAVADPSALFMHCLPAHRGEEVTDSVIDGPQSVVFDEAENRLHAQKGILSWCLEGD